MALTRAYEEHEVPPEIRRIYSNIRSSFDVPFVPTVFKLAAGIPPYLKIMWGDLGEVAASREFQGAAQVLQESAHSSAVSGGRTFHDQPRMLAPQRFSHADPQLLGPLQGVV